MSRDVAPIFADIDGMDADKFISHLTPDVRFRFANMDPAIGHAAVKEGVEGFWSTIDGLTHHIQKVTRSAIPSSRRSTWSTAARTASRSPCRTATSWSSTATWCVTGRSTSTWLPSSPDSGRRSMITLTDIAYVRSGVADLEAATRFATGIVGLELVTPTEVGVAHLRADGRHHCLALVEGPSGVISSGFTVGGPDALDAAETELERSGISVHRGSAAEARSRRVREFIAFDDPFGNRLELVSQQETVARPVAFSRAAGITEFGHLCLDAPDVHEAYRFWSTRFNARVSDWLGDAACLMRIDPVHHKLAVFRGDEPGLCHMNFQVETIDDVFRNWHFLVEHDVEIEMGPGRHPQSGAIFLYFLGPEGFTYEYSFGVRRIEDDAAWVPRTFDPAEPGSIDMWLGPTARPVTQPQVRSTIPAEATRPAS